MGYCCSEALITEQFVDADRHWLVAYRYPHRARGFGTWSNAQADASSEIFCDEHRGRLQSHQQRHFRCHGFETAGEFSAVETRSRGRQAQHQTAPSED